MKAQILAGLLALGLFPVAASAGHNDRYEDDSCAVSRRYDDDDSYGRSYRSRYERRYRYDDDSDGVSHHVHRRVQHHYRDYGHHGRIRHHIYRRVHHHYDD